jgi:glycopeptide antibiotics resistance protein
MKDLLLLLYECLTVILPATVLFAILRRHTPQRTSLLWPVLLTLYLFAAFHLTGAGTLSDALRYGIAPPNQINLIPFSREIDQTAYFQNVLLFLPLGFLLPYIHPRWDSFSGTTFAGFSFSLLIELSQLLNNRRTDVDDLILNTLGTLLGYLIYRTVSRLLGGRTPNPRPQRLMPFFCLFLLFLSRFLLYNELSAARLLFKF